MIDLIYIDYIVIIDLLLNFNILLTIGYILNRKTNFRLLFLSSSIGTINLIFSFMKLSSLILVLINIIVSFIMSIISFKYKDILYTIKNIIYMYLSSIFYGGFIYLINLYFFRNSNYIFYIIFLVITIPFISYLYIKSIKNIKINHDKYYQVKIYLLDDEIIDTTAFLDTGNKLIDPYSHKPIILLNKRLIKEQNQKKLYVPYNTVNNHSLLECIIPDKIFINKIGYKKRFLIGLIDTIHIEGIDCILNEKLL